MMNNTIQTIIVTAIVVAAVIWVAVKTYHMIRNKDQKPCCCERCDGFDACKVSKPKKRMCE